MQNADFSFLNTNCTNCTNEALIHSLRYDKNIYKLFVRLVRFVVKIKRHYLVFLNTNCTNCTNEALIHSLRVSVQK